MSDNWVVQNLENALETWNEKLAEIWQLLTQSPEEFKGGAIWNVIVGIHGAVQAIGLALLVLFFVPCLQGVFEILYDPVITHIHSSFPTNRGRSCCRLPRAP